MVFLGGQAKIDPSLLADAVASAAASANDAISGSEQPLLIIETFLVPYHSHTVITDHLIFRHITISTDIDCSQGKLRISRQRSLC